MDKFRFLEFATADVAFEAYGKDLNELFENAAIALFEIMTDTSKVEDKKSVKIEIEGNSIEDLLFNWLNELIFYVDAENMFFSKFNVKIDERQCKLFAECKGENIDPEKHELRTQAKACTYHKLKIEKKGDMWVARVLVDV